MKTFTGNRIARAALATLFSGALLFTAAPLSAAPGKKGHSHDHSGHGQAHGGHSSPHGMPGNATDATRTVLVIARDTEFNLKKIQVKAGETVRFIVRNRGELVHEFTIGTPEMQKEHQAEMQKMMDAGQLMADRVIGEMDHNHGNSVLVGPGEEAEVVWMFHENAELEFGCNIPGHYEQGMKGEFVMSRGG